MKFCVYYCFLSVVLITDVNGPEPNEIGKRVIQKPNNNNNILPFSHNGGQGPTNAAAYILMVYKSLKME